MLSKNHESDIANKSCILLTSAINKDNAMNSSCFIKDMAARRNSNFEYGARRFDELSFEIRKKVSCELGSIGDKYNGLNKGIQDCIKFKAKLEKKQNKLLKIDKELTEKYEMLQKLKAKWKETCGTNTNYANKIKQVINIETELKEKEKFLDKNYDKFKASTNEYKTKIKEVGSKLAGQKDELEKLKEYWSERDQDLSRLQTEFIGNLKDIVTKIDETRLKEKELEAEKKESTQKEYRIQSEIDQITEKIAKVSKLADVYGCKENKMMENFNEMKAKHFKTFGKKKVLLIKEQELALMGNKLEQYSKEMNSRGAVLSHKEELLTKDKMELEAKEQKLKIREQNSETTKQKLEKLLEDNRKKEEELSHREAIILDKENKEEQLQIKALGLEMTAQALRRKQELHKRCIENEKNKLRAKEDKLKEKEEKIGRASCRERVSSPG